jgi:hypothetical protein
LVDGESVMLLASSIGTISRLNLFILIGPP